ncbi:NUDIX domain-containing protein [Actinopolymorpha sp. B17G11]|uniref:NUDIX domain-containing protein n=1 Tax=Actinopolymorpha sp. B17G11 TaxID=3160861 RepID=UPI0032E3C172
MLDEIALAALVSEGRLLLAHRHPQRRWYPDCWDLVGGHLEPGETPEQAVRRECREEIAVDVSELRRVDVDLADTNLRPHAFLVTRWTGRPVNVAPEEHDALGWFKIDDLASLRLAHPNYAGWLPSLISGARPAR